MKRIVLHIILTALVAFNATTYARTNPLSSCETGIGTGLGYAQDPSGYAGSAGSGSLIPGHGSCFTPLYPDKVNLIPDLCLNNLKNFGGWGVKSLDSLSAFCGKYCGRIAGGSGSIDYTPALTPNKRYRMKAMVKTTGGSFRLGVSHYDGASADISHVINTNGEWRAIDFTFDTGPTVAGAKVFFNNYLKDGTDGYIDNWELYETGDVPQMNTRISPDQISEATVKATIRQMLVDHLVYAEGQYVAPEGYFGNGQSTEHGARTNADYALIYAFIYRFCRDRTLPDGITFETVKQHALSAIRYSCRTHKTGNLNCTNGLKWGIVWESSLWSESTGYAAWLMQDDLTDADKAAVKALVMAEANYNLSRVIPTQVNSDTKAEENGWDTNILAVASAMFPHEKNARAWTDKCRQFAMNSYSVASDAYRNDPATDLVDGKTVAEWSIGPNLFPDYALENHNFFHTSYLNIPIQELSESLLAYKAIQDPTKPVFRIPEALKHNVANVWNTLLKELIMADGSEAMPNGNDWSMYLYDELSTYSAMACIYRDPDALMLESILLQYARMRQLTTPDGAFLLHPDVGERRMAVTGRRLVFAHLYHDYFTAGQLIATKWADFSKKHETTKLLPYSNIVRSNNEDKYVTFSWFQSQDGVAYRSYMGMVSPNLIENSNLVFPYKTGNTGNFTGYADVAGETRNASLISNTYALYPKSFSTTGALSLTDGTLTKYLAFYSTPGKAIIYQEDMVATKTGVLTKDGGLVLGITTDILTGLSRTLYSQAGSVQSDGDGLRTFGGNWVNVDNILGMVVHGGNGIAFGEKELNTSVYVSKLYGSYSTVPRAFAPGDVVLSRTAIVYPKVNAATTRLLASKAVYPAVAAGWKAAAAEDPDGRRYLLVSNFRSTEPSPISLSYALGAPVFDRETTVTDTTGKAVFRTMPNSSVINELSAYVKTGALPLLAVQGDQPASVYVKNSNPTVATACISIWKNGSYRMMNVLINPHECRYVRFVNDVLTSDTLQYPGSTRNISRGKQIVADDQWPDHFPFATIDEVDSTYYRSLILPTAATPEHLTLSLWGLYTCNKLTLKSVDGIGPKDIAIQTSTDGISFTTVATATLRNTTDVQSVCFPDSKANYVRLTVTSTYGRRNVGIAALQLFGAPE